MPSANPPVGRHTKVELEVTDVWKGAVSGSPFQIVMGGGVLGEEQAVVSGQVQDAVGEEVVAFLVRNARGEGVTLGLMQGKFHVWKDTGGRTKDHIERVSRPLPRGLRSRSKAPDRPRSRHRR